LKYLSGETLQGLDISFLEVVATMERPAFVFRSVAPGDLAIAALACEKAGKIA